MRFVVTTLRCLALLPVLALPVKAQGQLNMVCAPQADWCEAIAASFQRETGIKVNMTRKSTGEILAQLRAEASNPRTDIWFGGTAEIHFTAAEGNLLQAYTSPRMAELHPWAQKVHQQSGGRCVGVSTGSIGFAMNTEIQKRKSLPEAKTWTDLLRPEFKGEIQLPNPNSSGTAYTIIAGLVQLWDEDRAFDYLKKLHAHVNAYTRSGAAPIQAVARGETGLVVTFDMEAQSMVTAGFPVKITYPAEGTSYEVACMSIIQGARNLVQARSFYDWYLQPSSMEIAYKVNQWHLPAHMKAAADPRLPNMNAIKLIDYDIATFGKASMRSQIISRWEREIGSLPR